MRILYMHQYYHSRKGQGGTRSYEFAKYLVGQGHHVTMITSGLRNQEFPMPPGKEYIEADTDEGIHMVPVAAGYNNSREGTGLPGWRRMLKFLEFARVAARVGKKLPKPDVVFATHTPLPIGIAGMKVGRHFGVPFVFEVRDLWPELPIAMGIVRNPLLRWYLQRMARRIYEASSHIVALAPGIKKGIVRTGYPAENVSLVPNASDLDFFRPDGGEPLDEEFGDTDDFRLVFTGAHGLANGLDAVLDVAAELKRRGATHIRFVFIGDGGLKPRLMARSREEGLDDLILWHDLVSKSRLATILPSMDVGMMILKNVPAFYDGTSPNKFFDYISCGLPVLNNYPGWIADHIRRTRCGVVVPPDDPQAFADAVIQLLENRDELVEMGKRARDLAEREFAREKLVDRLERVLLQAVKDGPVR